MESRTLTMEDWRLKMESWMVFRPMVADSNPLDKDQDPHWSGKLDPDPQLNDVHPRSCPHQNRKLDPGLDPDRHQDNADPEHCAK